MHRAILYLYQCVKIRKNSTILKGSFVMAKGSKRKNRSRGKGVNVSTWSPKRHPSETLEMAFFRRCHQIEHDILNRVAYEKQFNEQNFDSGWVLEEIIREALRELLPKRYSVRAGSISDSKGYTAGDCDVAIFNDLWFPAVKSGPTADSRRVYLPIEGVYGVLEVKQTLTLRTLEEAMRKLVTCSRLFRPPAPFDRLVENDERNACTHYVSNPLFTAVVAADIDPRLSLDEAVEKFIRINQMLPRTDVVDILCVLGHGVLMWVYRPDPDGAKEGVENLLPATFRSHDRYLELIPVYGAVERDDSPLYELMTTLMAHLTHSVLAPDGIAVHYGQRANFALPAPTSRATLPPDPTLLTFLNDACIGQDRSVDSAYHQHPPGQSPGADKKDRGGQA